MLRRKGTVLRCYSNMAETVTFSEIGMSVAVLEAGYNIDSLMLRYQVNTGNMRWPDERECLSVGKISLSVAMLAG